MQVRLLDSAITFLWPDNLESSNSVPIFPQLSKPSAAGNIAYSTNGGGRGEERSGDYCDDDGCKEIVLNKKR
jgi:hypothetical protein